MKITLKTIIPSILLFFIGINFSSCGAYLNQPTKHEPARKGEITPVTLDLKNLPKTVKPVVVAVYKFRDQTGQYKPTTTGAGFSTAVTQGATTILLKALEDSNWFIPLERENVSNLLSERKILKSSKSQRDGNKSSPLPPLIYSNIILEGGIISYDSNVMTGGVGARYFGTGGSSQYRQDRVSIYLRVVSTTTGEILKTVYTSKTILSQAVDVGVFRFVSFKKLLEAETGFTYNEPVELAVREAIEKAVFNLIMEGMIDNFWVAENFNLETDPRMVQYKADKIKEERTDILGREKKEYRKNVWIGANAIGTRLKGDLRNPLIRQGGEITLGSNFNRKLGWHLDLGYSKFAAEKFYNNNYASADFNLRYRILPEDRLTPSIDFGGGVFVDSNNNTSYLSANVGLNFEYILVENIGFSAGIQYFHLFEDNIDAIENGKYNDYLLKGKIGLKLYFGD